MAEELKISPVASKSEKYSLLFKQIKALCETEKNLIANLANITAALKETFGFFWVGFYIVDDQTNTLVLGPFQGPLACTRINYGKGVCGTAWEKNEAILVENVEEFPGHIACSSLSKSEIVVPISNKNNVLAVLDIDSDKFNTFDQTDQKALIELCEWIKTLF